MPPFSRLKGHCLEGLKCDWNPPPPSQCSGYSVTIILVYNKSKRKWKTTQHSTRTRVTENSKVGYNKQLKQIINTKRLKQKPWNWLSSLSYRLGVIIQTHVRLDGMCLLEWGIKIIVNVFKLRNVPVTPVNKRKGLKIEISNTREIQNTKKPQRWRSRLDVLPQAEGWVFEYQLQQTKVVKTGSDSSTSKR